MAAANALVVMMTSSTAAKETCIGSTTANIAAVAAEMGLAVHAIWLAMTLLVRGWQAEHYFPWPLPE